MLRITSLLCLVLFCLSCKNPDETVVMQNVDSKWDKKTSHKFDFSINDFQKQKNIIFIVRNNNDYPYSNLRLIAILEHNKKIVSQDTLNYVLAKPNGEWLGTGFGDTKEALFQYKLNYNFPQDGQYSLKVIQAMRRNVLPGIEDIGVKIQNIKPN